MSEEMFPIVDEYGNILGAATRKECHSGSFLLHPVVHLHVISPDGRILLQKRSASKDIQPGKWDTAVGGHIDLGESVDMALRREVREELNITDFKPEHLETYTFRSDREYELVNVYCWHTPQTIVPEYDPVEIDDVRYWSVDEIQEVCGQGILTPNFEQEFARLYNKLTVKGPD